MKSINKIIYHLLIGFLLSISLNGADKSITVKKGWSQLSVPLDSVQVDLLIADENIDVIWAYQNNRYRLLSKNDDYITMANKSLDIGILRSLSYGESIYVLAKEDSEITFVGQKNYNPPVRADHITSMWKQMSRDDFASTEWNVISKITQGQLIIASKVVMVDDRPSIKVYSNDPNEVAKINPEFFEDFEVGESESFWIKDVTNVDNINQFDFATLIAPTKGGDIADFTIDATSTNKNKDFLAVKIVAFKDGNPNNKEHILFDDYVALNQGTQNISVVMPMLLSSDFGTYRVYAIKDLAAQYDTEGIDIFNILNEDVAKVSSAYAKILNNSTSVDVSLNGNNTDVVYQVKLESREYANRVLYYDPVIKLNSLAENQSKDISEFSYADIGKHTEFQFNIKAFGNEGMIVPKTKVKAYITVNGTPREVMVLSDRSRLEDSYTLDNMQITLPDEEHAVDLALPIIFYGVDALKDNTDKALYNDVLADLSSNEEDKICLDSGCVQWIFKKEFEVGFAVADASDGTTEPTEADIIAKSTVTLYSETFSEKRINDYEPASTTLSLMNILLKEDIYKNVTDKRRAGEIGVDNSLALIDDLNRFKSSLSDGIDKSSLFNPLGTLELDLVNKLIYKRNPKGIIDTDLLNDQPLHDAWQLYIGVADVKNHLCDRKNYFNLTVPYTKKVIDPNSGDDLDILTATKDLCLYNVEYEYINTLSASQIDLIAQNFKKFIMIKNSRNEEDRVADFWNPLFILNNESLRIPKFFGKTMPVVNKKMGGGVDFNAKMSIDSELNQLRTSAYVDVDVALISDFKMLDLDFETTISTAKKPRPTSTDTSLSLGLGDTATDSRLDFYLYTVKPNDAINALRLKKVYSYSQEITTTYENNKKIDFTFAKGTSMNFSIGPVPVYFQFEIGAYLFFQIGVHLDISDHLMLYAIPGVRVFGTLSGGLGMSTDAFSLEIGIILKDFTVVRAAVPIVALLDKFRFDKNGFSADFSLFSNIELRAAEITVSIYGKIAVGPLTVVDIVIDLFKYKGFDPLKLAGLTVGEGLVTDVTDCQTYYRGFELFCINKRIEIEFPFSGLSAAECKLLDDEYLRRRVYDKDTSYLYSVNEYRKYRGCVNDEYRFINVALADWKLSADQVKELQNEDFWKEDSRALINKKMVLAKKLSLYSDRPWAFIWNTTTDDRLQQEWAKLTGYEW